MNKLRHLLEKRWTLSCVIAIVILAGSNCQPPKPVADPRAEILEDQVKMLVVAEAQEGFNDLFKAKFAAEKSRLLVGNDLDKWFQDHPEAFKNLPDETKEAVKNKRGLGLLIEGGLPGKNGAGKDVVYMRAPRFGVRRFFAVAQPDPCGDGNPATCEFCSGCSGDGGSGGIIHSCVCTMTCGDCHPCPTC